MKDIMNKSIANLLGKWDKDIPYDGYSSSIQVRTYKLYTTKIIDLRIDDLRFLIIQQIALEYLVPVALDYLRDNILTEGNYYEGDLLHALLLTHRPFWESNRHWYDDLCNIISGSTVQLSTLNPQYESDRKILRDRDTFLRMLSPGA